MKELASNKIKGFVTNSLFDEKTIMGKNRSFPKITIVTPSFNQGHFLERTILSVLNQNYPNLEYIIIDGGSTDGSIEIIKKYAKYLSYWTSGPDKGQASAINKGFRKSTGEIQGWICSDDLYLPGSLKKISFCFTENAADLVYGNTYFINERDEIIGEHRNCRYSRFFSKPAIINRIFSISQPSMFWKRDLYVKVGRVNENLCNALDNDLIIKFLLAYPKVARIREFISCERLHAARKTERLKHVALTEISYVKKLYGKTSEINFCNKLLAYSLKIYLFIKQGDFFWLLGRAIRRAAKSILKKISY
jgi:glycosyltransferase involved in cell wall biosynthesis